MNSESFVEFVRRDGDTIYEFVMPEVDVERNNGYSELFHQLRRQVTCAVGHDTYRHEQNVTHPDAQ